MTYIHFGATCPKCGNRDRFEIPANEPSLAKTLVVCCSKCAAIAEKTGIIE